MDLEGVKKALDSGVNIETKFSDMKEMTPLIIASGKGNKKIVQFLLDNGANIEAKSDKGFTALTNASFNGYIQIIQILLDNGANIETKINRGLTALMIASILGEKKVVQLLLDNGANIEAKDNITGNTALIEASRNGHIEIVQILLENGANIEAKPKSLVIGLLRMMIVFRKNKALKFIINSILDLFESINSLLILSKLKKNNRNTALVKASNNGHKAIVKLLIENGADVEFIRYKKKVFLNSKVKEIVVSMMVFILKLIFRGTPINSTLDIKELIKKIHLQEERIK